MPLLDFLHMLRFNRNTLISPYCWEDPYEKLFTKCNIIFGGTYPKKNPVAWKEWYCQCWSTLEESDGLWRSFSHNKEVRCVKLRTTVGKLKSSFETIKDKDVEIYMGNVFYSSLKEYEKNVDAAYPIYYNKIERLLNKRINATTALSLLMCKRDAFEYESEFRVFAHISGKKRYAKSWPYSFKVNDAIDEVIFDPWTKEHEQRTYTELIRDMGFKGSIDTSKLYKKIKNIKPTLKIELPFVLGLFPTEPDNKELQEELNKKTVDIHTMMGIDSEFRT